MRITFFVAIGFKQIDKSIILKVNGLLNGESTSGIRAAEKVDGNKRVPQQQILFISVLQTR